METQLLRDSSFKAVRGRNCGWWFSLDFLRWPASSIIVYIAIWKASEAHSVAVVCIYMIMDNAQPTLHYYPLKSYPLHSLAKSKVILNIIFRFCTYCPRLGGYIRYIFKRALSRIENRHRYYWLYWRNLPLVSSTSKSNSGWNSV